MFHNKLNKTRAITIILVVILLLVACGATTGGENVQQESKKVTWTYHEEISEDYDYDEFQIDGITVRCLAFEAAYRAGLSCDWK